MYLLINLLSRIVSVLPKSIQAAIAYLLGQFCWLLVPRKRKKMAIDNVIYGLKVTAQEAERIVKNSTTRFGRMFLEVLYMPNIEKNYIDQHVLIEGRHYLEEALSYGKGVVLATAHSGNWELLGATLAIEGFPLVAVVQKQTNDEMDHFINEYRAKAGMHVTYKTGVREMIKLLGEGRIIGLLMDQDAHEDGVMVNFFGRLASTPQGPAALARIKNAPIVPAFITEKADGKHAVIIHPPMWINVSDDRSKDILEMTSALTLIIEQHVRKYPHEWFWLHNRWKSTPE